jgi:uncharacterized protein YehS (DUF1456 family)
MIHNDVLRRLRFALRINDTSAIKLFKIVDYDMDPKYLANIMKKEEEPGYLPCRDKLLAFFLDALIIQNRGKREGVVYQPPRSGHRLTNNEILRKIRIAMSYQDSDIIALLRLVDFPIGKTELSALFRRPEHRNYKECGDQLLRNLLNGMVAKLRPESKAQSDKTVNTNKKYKSDRKSNTSTPTNTSVWGQVKNR